jgi:hypothetical protein
MVYATRRTKLDPTCICFVFLKLKLDLTYICLEFFKINLICFIFAYVYIYNTTRFMDHVSKWITLWAITTLWVEMIYLSSFIVP